MINITRNRWVIIRDGTDIFCGLARNYQFKPINNIGDTAVKTYLSQNKALASLKSSWHDKDYSRYKAVEVTESIISVEG